MPAVAESAKFADSAPQLPWPKRTSERIQAVRAVLADSATPLTTKQVAAYFTRAPLAEVAELLATLVALGHVQELDGGATG